MGRKVHVRERFAPGGIRSKTIPSHVRISRDKAGPLGYPFSACVTIGGQHDAKGRPRHLRRANEWCIWDKNPRRAVSKALAYASREIGKQKGAFAGLRRKRRRR